jgi:hypothetical protein
MRAMTRLAQKLLNGTLRQPHRIDDPGQFDRSSNGTAGWGDLFERCTGGSLKVSDPIDRCVKRTLLSR